MFITYVNANKKSLIKKKVTHCIKHLKYINNPHQNDLMKYKQVGPTIRSLFNMLLCYIIIYYNVHIFHGNYTEEQLNYQVVNLVGFRSKY